MEITDVRIRFVKDSTDRLKAFCSVTFDDQFVVRDIKIVDGANGLFVAMPSRKSSKACGKCGHRNQIRARFCEDCGGRLSMELPPVDENGRSRIHRDIAHPITPAFREMLHGRILDAYEAETLRADEPDYEPQEEGHEQSEDEVPARVPAPPVQPARREREAARVKEPVHEPELEADDEGPIDASGSEYDALIAGLKGRDEYNDDDSRGNVREAPRPQGGRGPRRDDRGPRRESEGRGPARDRQGGGRGGSREHGGDRGRRDQGGRSEGPRRDSGDRGRGGPRREESRSEAPVRREAPAARESARPAPRESAPAKPREAATTSERFGEGLAEPRREERVEKAPAARPAPVKPAAPAVEPDDDAPFGAGIL